MMDKKHFFVYLSHVKPYLLNKYAITCILFAVLFTFCGEHSAIERIKRNQQLRAMKQELKEARKSAAQYREDISAIQGKPEEIERFARERYYMHADNETVFVIEDDE